jgi:hypothetical protein
LETILLTSSSGNLDWKKCTFPAALDGITQGFFRDCSPERTGAQAAVMGDKHGAVTGKAPYSAVDILS